MTDAVLREVKVKAEAEGDGIWRRTEVSNIRILTQTVSTPDFQVKDVKSQDS